MSCIFLMSTCAVFEIGGKKVYSLLFNERKSEFSIALFLGVSRSIKIKKRKHTEVKGL